MAVHVDTWEGCYNEQWNGFIFPESFSHPAKYSKALIFRLIDHAMAEGWLSPGDLCADPFGGVGLGALPSLLKGVHWLGCELEPRFVALGQQNLTYWQQRYGHRMQGAQAWLLQGDSRVLTQILAHVDGIVSSPPYGGTTTVDGRTITDWQTHTRDIGRMADLQHGYGTTPGQLEGLPPGDLAMVLSSPPYCEGLSKKHTYQDHAKRDKDSHRRIMTEKGIVDPHYGTTPGNLGNLTAGDLAAIVSSPPYAGAGEVLGTHNGIDWTKARTPTGQRLTPGRGMQPYGVSEGQLGAMPHGEVGAIVSSPPYENSANCGGGIDFSKVKPHQGGGLPSAEPTRACQGWAPLTYGSANGQLGNASGQTFWEAAAQILAQCFALLPPGGHALFVTKPYIRDNAIVPFPDQWRALAEHVGFVCLHEHHALLSTQHGEEQDLFGGADVRRETRKVSFFRRLAENRGAPRIEAEIIHCLVKPH